MCVPGGPARASEYLEDFAGLSAHPKLLAGRPAWHRHVSAARRTATRSRSTASPTTSRSSARRRDSRRSTWSLTLLAGSSRWPTPRSTRSGCRRWCWSLRRRGRSATSKVTSRRSGLAGRRALVRRSRGHRSGARVAAGAERQMRFDPGCGRLGTPVGTSGRRRTRTPPTPRCRCARWRRSRPSPDAAAELNMVEQLKAVKAPVLIIVGITRRHHRREGGAPRRRHAAQREGRRAARCGALSVDRRAGRVPVDAVVSFLEGS